MISNVNLVNMSAEDFKSALTLVPDDCLISADTVIIVFLMFICKSGFFFSPPLKQKKKTISGGRGPWSPTFGLAAASPTECSLENCSFYIIKHHRNRLYMPRYKNSTSLTWGNETFFMCASAP